MVSSAKYLGINFNKRLTKATHIKSKKISLKLKLHNLRHLLRSNISLNNKIPLYEQLIRLAMTYSIQIWGSTKVSNLNLLQSFQSINLRLLTKALQYVSNNTLNNDLKIPTLSVLASTHYKKFHSSTLAHSNFLISNLSSLTIPDNSPPSIKT